MYLSPILIWSCATSQAFQVFCRVPSSCVFVSDHEVVCGGEDGVLLMWDIRNPRLVGGVSWGVVCTLHMLILSMSAAMPSLSVSTSLSLP